MYIKKANMEPPVTFVTSLGKIFEHCEEKKHDERCNVPYCTSLGKKFVVNPMTFVRVRDLGLTKQETSLKLSNLYSLCGIKRWAGDKMSKIKFEMMDDFIVDSIRDLFHKVLDKSKEKKQFGELVDWETVEKVDPFQEGTFCRGKAIQCLISKYCKYWKRVMTAHAQKRFDEFTEYEFLSLNGTNSDYDVIVAAESIMYNGKEKKLFVKFSVTDICHLDKSTKYKKHCPFN
jgi:hypothetical protein